MKRLLLLSWCLPKLESTLLQEPGTTPLPSETRTEPIIGWRVWHLVQHYSDFHLASYDRAVVWPRGTFLRAKMISGFISCGPGIYAFKSEPKLHAEIKRFILKNLIYGRVVMWGDVTEHEHGYRAEYAYPLQLFIPRAFETTYAHGGGFTKYLFADSNMYPLCVSHSQLATHLYNAYGCDVEVA